MRVKIDAQHLHYHNVPPPATSFAVKSDRPQHLRSIFKALVDLDLAPGRGRTNSKANSPQCVGVTVCWIWDFHKEML